MRDPYLRDNTAKWTRLDNAAKLYASVSSRRDPKVFRFACQLKEAIDPLPLQKAVEDTLACFPLYRSVLRRGLFWYFLEPSPRLSPKVREEDRPPCSPLYARGERTLLFDVTYYHQRINLEVCHVLTDGTGALQFLRTLVARYLALRHPELGEVPLLDYDASATEKSGDSFDKYYGGAPEEKADRAPKAAHVKGARLPGVRITEGELDARRVLARAKELETTMTPYLCVQLLRAIAAVLPLRELRKPVALTIPVNLRNYFESESARNFFAVFTVSHRFLRSDETEEEVLASVKKCFERELTREKLAQRMNRMAAMEHNSLVRVLPLSFKDIGLAFANQASRRAVSGGVSNLGRISMPENYMPYIHSFDVFMSTDHIQLCACSYNGRLMLSLTAPFVSSDVQKRFFRSFAALDPDMTIATND